ncbi:MAG: dUTP diphosphatase [Clostridia bacterium]|nr:dUTP diphosphatase [Clostridia bacterium]
MQLKVKIIEKENIAPVPLPKKQSEEAAGFNLSASIEKEITLAHGELAVIPTGIAVEMERGYTGLLFGRSGLGVKHGIHPSNAVGVIDSDYRGEICVGLCNVSSRPYVIKPFDRVAQLVIIKTAEVDIVEASTLSESERGEKGFGSTGKGV